MKLSCSFAGAGTARKLAKGTFQCKNGMRNDIKLPKKSKRNETERNENVDSSDHYIKLTI